MLLGLVGKPNVGKSTFFRAATLAQVACGNYPFVTIKPNHGTAYVKTECATNFFDEPTSHPRDGYVVHSKQTQKLMRFVPVELMDVAGLVPGAHEGNGMGNAFLDDLRQADVLIHVIDISGSTNEKGEQVETGSYDPANDIRFLEDELDFWYLAILTKGWEKFARTLQQTHGNIETALAKQLSGLRVTEDMVKDVLRLPDFSASPGEWSKETLHKLATHLRMLTKPMLIAANRIDVPGALDKLAKIKEQFPQYTIIPTSAESEVALREAAKANLIKYVPGENDFEIIGDLAEPQQKALDFIKTNILETVGSTGIQTVLDGAVYDILKYMPIFPGSANKLGDKDGNILPDCFLLPVGATALDFAYRLHSDFGDKFIRAIDAKTKRTVGRDHILKSGDVVEIVADA